MSALAVPGVAPAATKACPAVRTALLGTGNVGSAVIARLSALQGTPQGSRLSLVYTANTRTVAAPSPRAERWRETLNDARILIDATASGEVAARHARWLAQGVHVVTASKLGAGSALALWRDIRAACAAGGAEYGDSATVGAGLPLLRTLRDLQAGGDRIHALAGVLSGSLAWLLDRHDGRRPFSALVREARLAGYTEPDPREDLSGEDVRRKLLILARSAGIELDSGDVAVESLVPPALAALPGAPDEESLRAVDAPMHARLLDARRQGGTHRFVARLGRGVARVGLEVLPSDDPLAGGGGTDNRLAIWSDRYRERPLLIQGPGAGADVTAAALVDDALRIAACVPS